MKNGFTCKFSSRFSLSCRQPLEKHYLYGNFSLTLNKQMTGVGEFTLFNTFKHIFITGTQKINP